MKERLILLLSWVAFFWAAAALGIAFDDKYFIRGPHVGKLIADTALYVPIGIWGVLWVITGNPRIPPWKKVIDDD